MIYTVLTADVSADLVLLASSFRLFLIIQDKALRFRLSCLFSTCVITTAISLVNSSFILNADGLKLVIVAIVEVCKALGSSSFNINYNWTALRLAYPLLSPTSQFSLLCFCNSVNTLAERLGVEAE